MSTFQNCSNEGGIEMGDRQEYLPYPLSACSLPLLCYFSFECGLRTDQKGQGMDFKKDKIIVVIIIGHMSYFKIKSRSEAFSSQNNSANI